MHPCTQQASHFYRRRCIPQVTFDGAFLKYRPEWAPNETTCVRFVPYVDARNGMVYARSARSRTYFSAPTQHAWCFCVAFVGVRLSSALGTGEPAELRAHRRCAQALHTPLSAVPAQRRCPQASPRPRPLPCPQRDHQDRVEEERQ